MEQARVGGMQGDNAMLMDEPSVHFLMECAATLSCRLEMLCGGEAAMMCGGAAAMLCGGAAAMLCGAEAAMLCGGEGVECLRSARTRADCAHRLVLPDVPSRFLLLTDNEHARLCQF